MNSNVTLVYLALVWILCAVSLWDSLRRRPKKLTWTILFAVGIVLLPIMAFLELYK